MLQAMENSVVDLQKYNLEVAASDASVFSAEELAEDANGIRIGFERIKFPSGGSLMWELPSGNPESPDYGRDITGIIMHHHPANAYWPDGDATDGTPPTCSANDGKLGLGTPGGVCECCPNNMFAEDGSGKLCKNMHVLYLLREGAVLPTQINIPPTSLKAFRDFFTTTCALRRRCVYGSVVRITLVKATAQGGTEYSAARFELVQDLEGDVLLKAKNYAGAFKVQVNEIYLQREQEASQRADNGSVVYYEGDGAATVPGAVVPNGGVNCSREPLPD